LALTWLPTISSASVGYVTDKRFMFRGLGSKLSGRYGRNNIVQSIRFRRICLPE
jgi:hypothetical protein